MLQETFLHVVDGKVYVICPKCRKGMYRKVKNKMKSRGMVFCPGCKSKFVAQLDFRQQYRKITEFPGKCGCTRTGSFPVKIKNISRTGIKFEQRQCDEKLHIGEIVSLQFELDDKKSSRINVAVKICNANGTMYGGAFLEKYLSYKVDRNIKFWLL